MFRNISMELRNYWKLKDFIIAIMRILQAVNKGKPQLSFSIHQEGIIHTNLENNFSIKGICGTIRLHRISNIKNIKEHIIPD